jgi:hypothetical protein
VVNDCGPFACPLGIGHDGEVGTDNLNAFWQVGSAASNCGTHPVTSRCEMAGHSETKRTRPEDDVQFRFVRLLRCQGPHLRCTQRHDGSYAGSRHRDDGDDTGEPARVAGRPRPIGSIRSVAGIVLLHRR